MPSFLKSTGDSVGCAAMASAHMDLTSHQDSRQKSRCHAYCRCKGALHSPDAEKTQKNELLESEN